MVVADYQQAAGRSRVLAEFPGLQHRLPARHARAEREPAVRHDLSKSDVGIQSKGTFDAPSTVFYNPFVAKVATASLTYVTGSHSIKVGMQDKFGWIKNTLTENGNMVQVYNNGTPLQVRVYNTPIQSRSNLNGDFGLYLQDSWRLGRLTLNPGIRFERFNAEVDEQRGASRPLRRGTHIRPRFPTFRTSRTGRRASAPPTTYSATARPA